MKIILLVAFVFLISAVMDRKTRRSRSKREYFEYVITPGHKITDINEFYFDFDGKTYYPRQEVIEENENSDKLNLRQNGDLQGGLGKLYFVTTKTNPGDTKLVKLQPIDQKGDSKARHIERSIQAYINNFPRVKEMFGEDTALAEIEAFKVYRQTNKEKYSTRDNKWVLATLSKKYENIGDLKQYIENCPNFSAEEIIHLIKELIKIGKQLEFINMVHGDIKPENILVTQENDGQLLPKLVLIDMEGTQNCNVYESQKAGYEKIIENNTILLGYTDPYSGLLTGDTDDDKRSLSIIIAEIMSCYWTKNDINFDHYVSYLRRIKLLVRDNNINIVGNRMETYLGSKGIQIDKDKVLDILANVMLLNYDYIEKENSDEEEKIKTRKLPSYDEILEGILGNMKTADSKFFKKRKYFKK
jgi:serine/threonine protein kinase